MISIKKRHYYYQTWRFQLLAAISIAGVLYLLYQYRVSSIKKISEERSLFSHRLIESQQGKRKRIAVDFHGGLGQEIVLIKNRAEIGLQNGGNDESNRHFEDISETASNILKEVRTTTNDLRPQSLDKVGLTKTLKSIIRKISGVIEVKSGIDQIDGIFSEEDEINIYRIVQESLNDVVKHSNASDVSVRIKHL